MIRAFALLCAMLPAACTRPPAPVPHLRYTLGAPYQADGIWRYPRENYSLIETGLAAVQHRPHKALTADGEVYAADAVAAAHPTLQLPAIARVTNLENGRQLVLRINDRGPAEIGRMLALTPRAASLLGVPVAGVARTRLDVLPAESHAAADDLPGAPRLALEAAPRAEVRAIPLAAPAGVQQVIARTPAVPAHANLALAVPAPAATVTQVPPAPGRLWVRLSGFHQYRYALMQSARMTPLRGDIEAVQADGAQEFRARLGPFATISQADAALAQTLRAGVTDARIVVE